MLKFLFYQSSRTRADSYLQAVRVSLPLVVKDGEDVRAGLQRVLQVFITHTANVFLLHQTNGNIDLLGDQVME